MALIVSEFELPSRETLLPYQVTYNRKAIAISVRVDLLQSECRVLRNFPSGNCARPEFRDGKFEDVAAGPVTP